MTVALIVKLVLQRYLDSNVTDRFEVQLLNSAKQPCCFGLSIDCIAWASSFPLGSCVVIIWDSVFHTHSMVPGDGGSLTLVLSNVRIGTVFVMCKTISHSTVSVT